MHTVHLQVPSRDKNFSGKRTQAWQKDITVVEEQPRREKTRLLVIRSCDYSEIVENIHRLIFLTLKLQIQMR